MSEQDIQHSRELIEVLTRRKQERELQMAKLGVIADPVIAMEIKEMDEQIRHLSKHVLNPSSNYKQDTKELDNLEEASLPTVGIVSENNDLGRGITLGGVYKNVPLRIVATRWFGYRMSWTRSGWLFVPQLSHAHAIAFFKLHTQEDGSGYLHITDASDPLHQIWLTTGTGFRREDNFHYINNPMAIWPFEWK
jgi:hypothetical protein